MDSKILDFIFRNFGKFWLAGVAVGLLFWAVVLYCLVRVVLHFT
jgi:hypothetical protein